MGITDWARAARKPLVTGVAGEEGNSARPRLAGTWRKNPGVVLLPQGAMR
jgi:hypothetical protein